MLMNYNLTTVDIFEMSWRRFVLLFSSLFQWADDAGSLPEQYAEGGNRRSHYEQAVHEARGASGEISRSFDWDAALGREKPVSREILTTEEILSQNKKAQGAKVRT
jgi:hypothetical protein